VHRSRPPQPPPRNPLPPPQITTPARPRGNHKWEALEEHEKTWATNGLADLRYTETARTTDLHPSGKVTKVTVDLGLNGDHWTNDKCGVDLVG
jgi:hypothetical protein